MGLSTQCALLLQVGASGAAIQFRKREVKVPLEREWEFSAASGGE